MRVSRLWSMMVWALPVAGGGLWRGSELGEVPSPAEENAQFLGQGPKSQPRRPAPTSPSRSSTFQHTNSTLTDFTMGNKPKSILKKQKAAIPADFEEVAAAAAPVAVEAELDEMEQDDESDELDEADDDSFGELSDSEDDSEEEDDEDMIRALQDGGDRPAKSEY